MKPKTPSSVNLMLGLGALVGALAGCAHSNICIKAIDATTKEPLADVTTVWRQDRHQMFRTMIHDGPINLSASHENGIIEVGAVHRNWVSTLIFSCPGYSNVYGSYTGGSLTLAK